MTKRRAGPVAAWERRAVVELSTHVCDSEEKMRHTYVISYKFNWRCSAPGCNYAIGRHSNSLDTTKYVCGRCAAPLVAVPQPT